jgi:uncharacterized protein
MVHCCPGCKKPFAEETEGLSGSLLARYPDFPFCSRRCRLADLNGWLEAEYRIPVVESPNSESQSPDTGSIDPDPEI